MELIIIILLIILNGIFAMAEIAIISVRKSHLAQKASEGDKNAEKALLLAEKPSRFLSAIQVGITLIGIFSGAFGGATIARKLSIIFSQIPFVAPVHEPLSLLIVVIVITYLTLIIGELVPKRLALSNPEKAASLIARPMTAFSNLFSPVITLLSSSTDWILQLVGVKSANELIVSEEEIRTLIKEGAKLGVFQRIEKDIVERTLQLGDKKAKALMTARSEISWIDINSSFAEIQKTITKKPCSYYPVCKNVIDNVVGVIRTEDMLKNYLSEKKIDLQKTMLKPLLVPETTPALKVLELFKKSGVHMALIVNEYGSILGLISLTNIFEGIVGNIPSINEDDENDIIKRSDGSFLIDGLMPIDKFKEHFKMKMAFPEEKSGFQTIGGFVMNRLGHIPKSGEKFIWDVYRFEVIDMDGNRVDKVLLSKNAVKKN